MLIIDRSGAIREEHSGRERNYYSYTNLNRFLDKYLQRAGFLVLIPLRGTVPA